MNGILCIHGFTGSPKEVEPLVSFLKDETDWVVHAPILPGHGENLCLRNVQYMDWIRHAEEELQKLMEQCDKIYICGFSMGGLIGSFLATRYPVTKMILLSAAAYYTNPKHLYYEMRQMIADGLKNSFRDNEIFQKYKRKLTSTPLRAYWEFRKLVQNVRPVLSNIDIPTLIVQGKQDPIVPEKSAHYLYGKIKTQEKQLMLIENANHHICYSEEQNKIFNEILHFLEEPQMNKKIALTNN